VGKNPTLIKQLDPGQTVEHLLASVKSAGFVPPMAILDIESIALPVFDIVTAWVGALDPKLSWGKLSAVEERLTKGEPGVLLPPPPPPLPPQPTQTTIMSNPDASIQYSQRRQLD
jgi:hypothetical protein